MCATFRTESDVAMVAVDGGATLGFVTMGGDELDAAHPALVLALHSNLPPFSGRTNNLRIRFTKAFPSDCAMTTTSTLLRETQLVADPSAPGVRYLARVPVPREVFACAHSQADHFFAVHFVAIEADLEGKKGAVTIESVGDWVGFASPGASCPFVTVTGACTPSACAAGPAVHSTARVTLATGASDAGTITSDDAAATASARAHVARAAARAADASVGAHAGEGQAAAVSPDSRAESVAAAPGEAPEQGPASVLVSVAAWSHAAKLAAVLVVAAASGIVMRSSMAALTRRRRAAAAAKSQLPSRSPAPSRLTSPMPSVSGALRGALKGPAASLTTPGVASNMSSPGSVDMACHLSLTGEARKPALSIDGRRVDGLAVLRTRVSYAGHSTPNSSSSTPTAAAFGKGPSRSISPSPSNLNLAALNDDDCGVSFNPLPPLNVGPFAGLSLPGGDRHDVYGSLCQAGSPVFSTHSGGSPFASAVHNARLSTSGAMPPSSFGHHQPMPRLSLPGYDAAPIGGHSRHMSEGMWFAGPPTAATVTGVSGSGLRSSSDGVGTAGASTKDGGMGLQRWSSEGCVPSLEAGQALPPSVPPALDATRLAPPVRPPSLFGRGPDSAGSSASSRPPLPPPPPVFGVPAHVMSRMGSHSAATSECSSGPNSTDSVPRLRFGPELTPGGVPASANSAAASAAAERRTSHLAASASAAPRPSSLRNMAVPTVPECQVQSIKMRSRLPPLSATTTYSSAGLEASTNSPSFRIQLQPDPWAVAVEQEAEIAATPVLRGARRWSTAGNAPAPVSASGAHPCVDLAPPQIRAAQQQHAHSPNSARYAPQSQPGAHRASMPGNAYFNLGGGAVTLDGAWRQHQSQQQQPQQQRTSEPQQGSSLRHLRWSLSGSAATEAMAQAAAADALMC
ncbi:hypothetical protein HYH03_007305 [Edaphochlamys debaryana]|uniref:Uncharacterized protein n=1 Tax=Edaphochlamys debaryana TaxID=47281 RepID=A0A835Y248_9CHLO|nr:hypothetical protein HYH03_007305 [Edaphochlamys debaryana]|eukprot:KAG2494538.1 hypothetical protein HYH03_007305 [Edaphochlamys debaryana]